MDGSNYSLIKLIIDGWVFGKPFLLTLVVFVIVRKRLDKKVPYLLLSLFCGYVTWYIIGRVMLPWMAGAVRASIDPVDYSTLMCRAAAIQVVEVLSICLVAYVISKVSWFRNHGCS
jgi:ABC-type polysaccharide/polyol phosphate export permease